MVLSFLLVTCASVCLCQLSLGPSAFTAQALAVSAVVARSMGGSHTQHRGGQRVVRHPKSPRRQSSTKSQCVWSFARGRDLYVNKFIPGSARAAGFLLRPVVCSGWPCRGWLRYQPSRGAHLDLGPCWTGPGSMVARIVQGPCDVDYVACLRRTADATHLGVVSSRALLIVLTLVCSQFWRRWIEP